MEKDEEKQNHRRQNDGVLRVGAGENSSEFFIEMDCDPLFIS